MVGEQGGAIGSLFVNFEGMDALDIAAHLNIATGTNIHVALTRLIGFIQEQGLENEERHARIQALEKENEKQMNYIVALEFTIRGALSLHGNAGSLRHGEPGPPCGCVYCKPLREVLRGKGEVDGG